MKLRFRPDALRDLEEIQDYIAKDNPAAAARTIGNVVHSSRDLEAMF